MSFVEFLGANVNIECANGTITSGMVMAVGSKSLTLQTYRLPSGLRAAHEQLALGEDIHFAFHERQELPNASVRRIQRIDVAVIQSNTFSNATIDRLGDRLRTGELSPETLRLLDTWRRGFRPVYRLVVSTLDGSFRYKASGRPGKTTGSIVEKLMRETTRLSQMQDIAGCRIIVPDITAQNQATSSIASLFTDHVIIDRRKTPSHGYRAVHIVAMIEGRPVEIQIRTVLQHTWAELSQKLADVVDKRIKYGAGHAESLALLRRLSDLGATLESAGVEMESQRAEVIDIMVDFNKIAIAFRDK